MLEILHQVDARFAAYDAAEISSEIDACEDMYVPGPPEHLDHYLQVGRDAIALIARAMVMTGGTQFDSVLDMPCGGGRVTRHLVRFFPDARIWVADANPEKAQAVVDRFGATALLNFDPGFHRPPGRRFGLIFVGSLLTHLDEAAFGRCLSWLIDATDRDGMLIATTHGRKLEHLHAAGRWDYPDDRWSQLRSGYDGRGFGFFAGEGEIGMTMCKPSWLARQIEGDSSLRFIFADAAWVDAQDALIIHKRPLT